MRENAARGLFPAGQREDSFMKKKWLAALLAGAFLLSGAAPGVLAAAASSASIAEAPGHLLVLGDSIASGYGLADPASQCFGAQFAAKFNLKAGEGYQNLAVDGSTSRNWADALDPSSSGADAAAIAAVKSADVILLSVGGNDVLGPFLSDLKTALGLPDDATAAQLEAALASNPDISAKMATLLNSADAQARYAGYIAAFGENLASIAASVRAENPSAALYVQTVYNPFDGVAGYGALSSAAGTVLASLNGVVSSGAAAGGYTAVDVASAFAGKAPALTNIASGDIHPNAAGHDVIFELYFQAVTSDTVGSGSTSSVPPSSGVSGPSGASSGSSPVLAVSSSAAPVENPSTGGSPVPSAILLLGAAGIAALALRRRHK